MLYLKLMSGQDMSDSDPTKDYTLITVSDEATIDFLAPDEAHEYVRVVVSHPDGKTLERDLDGNAYVLNAQGKTIASRAAY